MNHTKAARIERKRSPRQKREGAALLIVLFILMMATGTAMFTLQSTQFEQRAAGSLLQSARTKYVAEAATMGVLALCDERGVSQCADLFHVKASFANERPKFALPPWGQVETVYQLEPSSLAVRDVNTGAFKAAVVPLESELNAGGIATAFTPDFVTIMEKWEVPNPSDARKRYRLVVSTFGELGVVEPDAGAGELRRGHESISATRAFFDVKE